MGQGGWFWGRTIPSSIDSSGQFLETTLTVPSTFWELDPGRHISSWGSGPGPPDTLTMSTCVMGP